MAHIPRLYVPSKLERGSIAIDGPLARRIGSVLRMREGDRFIVFSGDGNEWQICIENVGRQRVHARVEELLRKAGPNVPQLEMVIANVRSNRMDWALEKCAETGADAIRPITTAYSTRGSGDSASRRERWERILVEAAEQCGRLYLPVLLDSLSFDVWLKRSHECLLFGDTNGAPWDEVQGRLPRAGTVTFAIGPEGGFSPEEQARMRAAGGTGVRLGPNILRTETAAMVASALVRSMGR